MIGWPGDGPKQVGLAQCLRCSLARCGRAFYLIVQPIVEQVFFKSINYGSAIYGSSWYS
jgi:hypothetical protein